MRMTGAEAQFFASVPPFDILSPEERAKVGAVSVEKHFRKGETIFEEGLPARTVWIVKEGRVHLDKAHSNGKVSTLCVMTGGELLCCIPALDRGGYPATAIAKEPTTLIGIPSDSFSRLMADTPALSARIVSTLCKCLRGVEERARSQAYDSAEKRVGNVLLMIAKKFGPEIPLTREDFAALSGLTVETTIRMTSRLKEHKLLSSNGKGTLKLDITRLRAHIDSL
ncbi:MAG: Crp/Fnr family transcriptional regulator [Deltaproteobacteria bacterium]|nr:Crp/Fnr family transcriptional regulator [Deltaproteobacteria bacterium]